MKKSFTLAVLMLLSITTLHATVVTKDFDLSGMSNYGTATVSGGSITAANKWHGAVLWQWMEGALQYDHVVLEVADHANPILFRIQYSDGSEVEKQLPAGVNTMAIEITQDIVKGVFVLNWSENNDVSITITGLYLRGGIGDKKDVTLWNEGKVFDEWNSWEDRITLGATLFDDLHAGDILEINYTPDEQSYHQLKMHLDWAGETPLAFLANTIDEYQQININTTENPTQMRFPIISETDVTNIKAQGGLAIHGKYITVNSVKLIRHDVLWSGTQEVDDNWSGGQSIAWSKLSSLRPGNLLCVRVTEGSYVPEKYNQVLCTYNSSWSGTFSPSVNYQFQAADEMPMIVEIPITHKMLYQLNGEQLNVGGRNFTMTDIFIKEGTPLTTKAAYLNVTAAGMATYVLPFDVPSLPDGVEAYNLTNDGTNEIVAEQVYSLTEDNPVLIIAAEGEYEFVSAEGESDDVSGKSGTYSNGALVGTYAAIDPLAQTTGGNYNYILQKHEDEVAFYQVLDGSCSVAAYHAYLSCGYNANSGGSPAPMRMVFRPKMPTATENTQQAAASVQKVLKDGQLYILRGNTMYTIQGQTVK